MIYCRIEDGVVVNRMVVGDEGLPDDWQDASAWVSNEEAQIGWLYDGGKFSPPAEKPTSDVPLVPDIISDWRFFQQLAVAGMITQTEALEAVKTGDIPAAMEAFINTLPADQQFSARMVLCGATQFSRSHPLVAEFAAANGMTSDQVDDLWIKAAKL